MNLLSSNKKSKREQSSGTKTAALVLIGLVTLAFAGVHSVCAQEQSGVAPATAGATAAIPPEVTKQIEALTKRVEQLEKQFEQHEAAGQPTTVVQSAKATAPVQMLVAPVAIAVQDQSPAAQPTKPEKIAPFSDWDWTWLNGNPRNKDTAFDSKFFTPEIRADITYNYDFNRPIDDSMGGSSELFRANEIQLEQLGRRRRLPL